jgi:hypothetical protein
MIKLERWERSMDASAVANAESWLSTIAAAKLIAAALVALGVVIEFGSDWVARPFEKTVNDARALELATLRNETAAATQRAAEANREVAELKGPRNLTQNQTEHILWVLNQYGGGGRPYDLSVPKMLEPGSFLDNQLIATLAKAGWELRSMKGDVSKRVLGHTARWLSLSETISEKERDEIASRNDVFVGVNDGVIGVIVTIDPSVQTELKDAARGLSAALSDDGIIGSIAIAPAQNGMAEDVIHIAIGTK